LVRCRMRKSPGTMPQPTNEGTASKHPSSHAHGTIRPVGTIGSSSGQTSRRRQITQMSGSCHTGPTRLLRRAVTRAATLMPVPLRATRPHTPTACHRACFQNQPREPSTNTSGWDPRSAQLTGRSSAVASAPAPQTTRSPAAPALRVGHPMFFLAACP
jgi:hypothetical protein